MTKYIHEANENEYFLTSVLKKKERERKKLITSRDLQSRHGLYKLKSSKFSTYYYYLVLKVFASANILNEYY